MIGTLPGAEIARTIDEGRLYAVERSSFKGRYLGRPVRGPSIPAASCLRETVFVVEDSEREAVLRAITEHAFFDSVPVSELTARPAKREDFAPTNLFEDVAKISVRVVADMEVFEELDEIIKIEL